MKNKKINNKVVIYQSKAGAIELKGDLGNETLWASQNQISEVFGIERSVVTKHVRNIFKDKELDKNSVCAKIAHTAEDNKIYQVQYYNLDINDDNRVSAILVLLTDGDPNFPNDDEDPCVLVDDIEFLSCVTHVSCVCLYVCLCGAQKEGRM